MKTPSKKQVEMMRLALGLSGMPCNDAAAETVLLVVDGLETKGDQFSLRDASAIEYQIMRKYNRNKITVASEKKKK